MLPIDAWLAMMCGRSIALPRATLTGVRLFRRASLLGVDRTLEEGTLDKYAYARDFYLQQRRYRV